MTKKEWTIIGVLGAAVVIVLCCGGILIFATLTPPQTQAVALEVTVIPSPFPSDTPTPRPTLTPKPTPTLAVLKMTIDEIENCCKDMTTIQENQHLASLVGSRVNWQGTVDDAKLDGTIWVTVSSTLIEMNGAPSEVAAKLSKGQLINFYAIITKAENSFLKPGVQLRFESLNTNPAAANSPTPKPISSPTPAPTWTPTLNAAEQSYRQALLKIMDSYSAACGDWGDELHSARDDPSLTFDKQWRAKIMATMALLKQDGTNLRKLKPPTRYASMHADLVTMSTHLDKAVDYYTKGLNTIDASQFDLGNQEIDLANSALDSAQEELSALR